MHMVTFIYMYMYLQWVCTCSALLVAITNVRLAFNCTWLNLEVCRGL